MSKNPVDVVWDWCTELGDDLFDAWAGIPQLLLDAWALVLGLFE
ncbi:hypothetical protein P5V56_04440 [Mycobacteroides abscessus subsp. abscessus]|nr:hypothetical protein [Mycobacteroides abscessus]MDO3146430.1 hypothetical protein [Mycobacteroides abscessus subsp. abscessus]